MLQLEAPLVIFETPKAVLLTITDATEDQNVLGFGQSMVFVGLHLALCALASSKPVFESYGHCRVGCPNGSLTPARPQNEAAVMVMLTGP